MQTARIDLHLHLDGSLNLRWAYEKALQRGAIAPGCSFEEFYGIVYANNTKDRALSILKFELMCDVLQYREDLIDATAQLVRTLREKGLLTTRRSALPVSSTRKPDSPNRTPFRQ